MKIRGGGKLPELAENSELDDLALNSTSVTINGSHTSFAGTSADKMLQVPLADVNSDVSSTFSNNPVTPSMPDSLLNKLGLAAPSGSSGSSGDNFSLDQLPEKDIESKFISLSLAFKTDKLTLDQRVIVQERSRDLAEKNVDTQLHGLRDAVEILNDLVTDNHSRGILQKIKQHIGILEQLAARVSSRAEVFGAVQQEKRMCKAMEVMVLYTENLRRIREKEESELQEARKLLSEKSVTGYSNDSDSGTSRRSMSVSGVSPSGRPIRRRSEATLPRIIVGAGSPPLNSTSNLGQVILSRLHNSATSLESEGREDPKSRFQSAVASTTMQQVVATTLKRYSMEKQRSISLPSGPFPQVPETPDSSILLNATSSTLSVKLEATSDNLSETQEEKQDIGSRSSQEEEAFRRGFEEGLKARLSQELSELRNQQKSISQSLDHVMDKVEKTQMEDVEYISSPSWFEMTVALASKIRDHILLYDWKSNKTTIRNLTGLTFLLMAFVVVFLCPPTSSVGIGRFAKPAR
ncbi:hypothetical protein BsWGS_12840 [Bradybaena similaris]